MTTLDEHTAVPARGATLRALAALEASRYARHPLFLIGVGLLVTSMVMTSRDIATKRPGQETFLVDPSIMPAFFLGMLGVFVGVHLTRSIARSAEPIEASPTDGVTRTAAMCLACLVPAAAALVWVAWTYTVTAVWPVPDGVVAPSSIAAIRAAGVVSAVGGPLFGVMVGRWTRFPGAALLAAFVLYAWAGMSNVGASSASRIGVLAHVSAPWSEWVYSDSPIHDDPWVAAGSPPWHLVYITLLCGLAASAAMLHDAWGTRRSRLVRVSGVLVALALASLTLAAAPDPNRIPL